MPSEGGQTLAILASESSPLGQCSKSRNAKPKSLPMFQRYFIRDWPAGMTRTRLLAT